MARRIEGDFDYIVVGAGTAGCIMANRLSANPNQPRPDPGGRRQRQLDLVPHPGRLSLRDRQSPFRLDVPDRAGAGPQRPLAGLSPRQGDRRLLGHQRHDLDAGPGRRLRPLAAARSRPAGAGTTCCRRSGGWRITSSEIANITAPAAAGASRRRGCPGRCWMRSARPRSKWASARRRLQHRRQ